MNEIQGLSFCDLRCIYASAPRQEMDGSRSCMTFNAIWCDLHRRHVMKSQPCRERRARPLPGPGSGGREPRKD